MRPLVVLTALFLVLLTAGAAAAQAPTVSITLAGFPEAPMELTDNSSSEFKLKVTLTANNFMCTGEGEMPVEIATQTDLGGVDNITVTPNPLPFQPPPGVYSPLQGPYNETQEATITFNVLGEVPSNHTHDVQVTANYAGGEVANCHGSGSFPAASADGAFTASLVAQPDPVDNNGTNVQSDDKGLPGPGLPLVALGLGLAARRFRRRE